MSTGEHEVVLLRHGETHGYHDDVGLTALGERQARDAGLALARDLTAGTTVHLLHAPTARATATAVVLGEELAGAATVVGPEPDGRFDSIRFLVDSTDSTDSADGSRGEARESSGVAAQRLAYGEGTGAGRTPDWVAEFDRFDSDFGALSKLGGPIDRWLVATTRHFEPPQVVVYRAWAGIADRARRAAPGSVTVIASHSALLRAVAAAAVGHDPGEPANLEAVHVTVAGGLARVRYREHDVVVEVPTTLPPWLSPDYLA